MKNKKLLIYLSSISFLIISFFVIYQYSIHVSTRNEAIDKYLSTLFDDDSSELIHIVETDIPNTYYLLLRTNGSDRIKFRKIYLVGKSRWDMKKPTQILGNT